MNKKGFVDMDIVQAPGFIILAVICLAAIWMGKRWIGMGMPLGLQIAVSILILPVIYFIVQAKSE